MKKLMKVMSAEYGDKPYLFDTEDVALNIPPEEATALAAAEAKALFERIMKQGGAAFEVGSQGETKARVKNFEQLGEQNVLVPKFEGG